MSAPHHSLSWRKQVIRDLDDISPYLFGIIMLVLSATFVGSLGMSLLMNLGWVLIGMLVLLVGMLTVALFAAVWVAGKMPDGPHPRGLVVSDTWISTDELDKFISEFETARFGVRVTP